MYILRRRRICEMEKACSIFRHVRFLLDLESEKVKISHFGAINLALAPNSISFSKNSIILQHKPTTIILYLRTCGLHEKINNDDANFVHLFDYTSIS